MPPPETQTSGRVRPQLAMANDGANPGSRFAQGVHKGLIMPSTLRLLGIAPIVLLLGCGKKEVSREHVHSDLIQSISLASEAETFVRYVAEGHSTSHFASGHLRYLLDEVNRHTQELLNPNASPELINVLNVDRIQLKLLAGQIDNAQRHLQEPTVLAAGEEQIRKIRVTLVQARSSL